MNDARVGGSVADDWHVVVVGERIGPLALEEVRSLIDQGRLGPDDLVWRPLMSDWLPARRVRLLFPTDPAPPDASVARNTTRSSRSLVVTLAVVAVVALVAGLLAITTRSSDDDAGIDVGTDVGADVAVPATTGSVDAPGDLGEAWVTPPAPESLVVTDEWGLVAADQLVVLLEPGQGRAGADRVADALDGNVVGGVELIDLYQISFASDGEAQLRSGLEAAEAVDGVEAAYADQEAVVEGREIWGERLDPIGQGAYGGRDGMDGRNYEMIGLATAWELMDGSGLDRHPVHVGLVDSGLFLDGDGREHEFGGDVNLAFPDADAGVRVDRELRANGDPDPAGSHGTAAAAVVAADADNGGAVGVASVLRDDLTVSVINFRAPTYATNVVSTPDPGDPSQYTRNGVTYSVGALAAMHRQLTENPDLAVLNLSFGHPDASPELQEAYRRFFERMAVERPNVLFVASAGNESLAPTHRPPGGMGFPNVITVASVDHHGSPATYTNRSSTTYAVDIAAPGDDVVVGLVSGAAPGTDPDRAVLRKSGTSFAAPMVSGTAALLRSIDPTLTAAQLKEIILANGRTATNVGGPDNPDGWEIGTPADIGGRVLATDLAVLAVVNRVRAREELDPLTIDELRSGAVIDAVAVAGTRPGDYVVRGIVAGTGPDGVDVTIRVSGQHALGGSSTQRLAGPGEATWDLTLTEDRATILVTRNDNNASSLITIEPQRPEQFSITFDFTTTSSPECPPADATFVITLWNVGAAGGDEYAEVSLEGSSRVWFSDGEQGSCTPTTEPLGARWAPLRAPIIFTGGPDGTIETTQPCTTRLDCEGLTDEELAERAILFRLQDGSVLVPGPWFAAETMHWQLPAEVPLPDPNPIGGPGR